MARKGVKPSDCIRLGPGLVAACPGPMLPEKETLVLRFAEREPAAAVDPVMAGSPRAAWSLFQVSSEPFDRRGRQSGQDVGPGGSNPTRVLRAR
jgi:hypothetical protein